MSAVAKAIICHSIFEGPSGNRPGSLQVRRSIFKSSGDKRMWIGLMCPPPVRAMYVPKIPTVPICSVGPEPVMSGTNNNMYCEGFLNGFIRKLPQKIEILAGRGLTRSKTEKAFIVRFFKVRYLYIYLNIYEHFSNV